MTQILLIGGPLRQNLGGPSIVQSLEKLLKDTIPGAQVQILAFWRKSFIESEQCIEVPFSPVAFMVSCLKKRLMPLRHIIRLYRQADIVIDYWGLAFTDAKKRNPVMRLMEGFPMLLGKIFSKPVVKYTADMGPFTSWANKLSARFYLRHIDLILARSETTKNGLKELGIQTPIAVCPDTALLLEPAAVSKEEIEPLNSLRLIGLSVSHVAERKVGANAYVTMMAELCDHIVEHLDASVLIIPNEIFPENPAFDDLRVAQQIAEKSCNQESVKVLSTMRSASYLKGIIGMCHLVIASRYHTVVAALSQGVPTLSLSWHEKYSDLMRLFGQEKNVQDLGTLSVEDLKRKVNALWDERDKVHEEVTQHAHAVREEILKGARLTKQILENGKLELASWPKEIK